MFNVEEKVLNHFESKKRVFPCRSNRASSMGHECARYLTYCRTRWEDKRLPEPGLLYIFNYGNTIEDMAIKRLQAAGFKISNQQRDFEDKQTGITGHIDCFLANGDGKEYPCEIKSMSPYIWDTIDSVEDMYKSDKKWVRGYPGQLQLYLLLSEKEEGLFYLVNKLTSQGKDIWMKLNYGYAESLLKKAEEINRNVIANTVPNRIPYNPEMCRGCDFEHICLPPAENNEELLIEAEPVIEEALNRRAEVEVMSKEYSKLDKKIKDYIKTRASDKINIGDWFIEKKTTVSMSKPKEATEITRTTIFIKKLTPDSPG